MQTQRKTGASRRRSVGSHRNFYGEPTVQIPIYPPVSLRTLIEREQVLRTVRDGPRVWNESRVIVDLLYQALGVKAPRSERQEGNDD